MQVKKWYGLAIILVHIDKKKGAIVGTLKKNIPLIFPFYLY
jgi:hypothetical protein